MALRRKPGRPKEKLSEEDMELLQEYGLNDSEIELMEQRLKRGTWTFNSRAKRFRLNLSQEDDVTTRDGRTIPGRNRSADFTENMFETTDWPTAMRVYLSDAFRTKRIVDMHEKKERDQEEEYQGFKDRVLSDPERLARLRQDLFSEEISEDDRSNVPELHG